MDDKKYEEDLIKRLLVEQFGEKNEAYSRWRAGKCKKMLTDNKRGHAFKQEMVKEVKNK